MRPSARRRAALSRAASALGERSDAPVMARGYEIAIVLTGVGEQRTELEVAVAIDAGIGGAPCLIGPDEFLHHMALEGLAHVDDLVGEAQACTDRGGVVGVRPAAAGAGRGIAVQQHGGAKAVVPLLGEQVGGDARIDAAAHGDEYALAGHGSPLRKCLAWCVRLGEEGGGEVALTGIGEQGNDGFSGVFGALRQLEGCPGGGSR